MKIIGQLLEHGCPMSAARYGAGSAAFARMSGMRGRAIARPTHFVIPDALGANVADILCGYLEN